MRTPRYLVVLLALVALMASACSESGTDEAGDAKTSTTVDNRLEKCAAAPTVVSCIPPGSMVEQYLPTEATTATGEPIVLGTINQDTGAAGAFPELTTADKVAIDFINTELGGVDGRPIELITCDTKFSPDLSQSCAQEMVSKKVSAVIGGIDVWGTGITTLENNGIPYVGGIPVSFEAARSPVSFQFSGGTWGAVLGQGEYAIEDLNARKIALIYTEFGPITNSAELGKKAMEAHGAEVTLVSVAPINADMVTAINTAVQSQPDAILALTADTGCKPTMDTLEQLGVATPTFYTGACSAPSILDAVGDAADGAIFNLEADLDAGSADNIVYRAVSAKYGAKYNYDWQSAGTVSFRSVINLYAQLREIGGANVAPARIIEKFRAARDVPSFFGHPYTCDGKQLDGYPALCAPQQTLGKIEDGVITQATDWLDVGAFAR